jgi:hypothetical protein
MAKDQDLDLFGAVRLTRPPSSSGVWSPPGRSAAAPSADHAGFRGDKAAGQLKCVEFRAPTRSCYRKSQHWLAHLVANARSTFPRRLHRAHGPREFALMSRHRRLLGSVILVVGIVVVFAATVVTVGTPALLGILAVLGLVVGCCRVRVGRAGGKRTG